MSPTIRIDEGVWSWLKQHARPFEDTPNSVLRRLAGLDPAISLIPQMGRGPQRVGESFDGGLVPAEPDGAASRPHAPIRPTTYPSRVGERTTGEALNRRHHIGARHALFHKDGTFYERLARFPGVLCDPGGYVRYESESQFTSDEHINIGQKVNVHGSLSIHPRYHAFESEEVK